MNIEVILNKKLDKVGAEGDLVTVKAGYARNYLIPKGLATLATSATKLQVERLKKIRAEREEKEKEAALELASKIGSLRLTFNLIGEEKTKKVFGAVTSQDICEKLAQEGIEIDRKKISLERPLKESGLHVVPVHVHQEVLAQLQVELVFPKKETETETTASQEKKNDKKKKNKKGAQTKKTQTKKGETSSST
ncbi:50S ribosomal protein L9 [Methylacidiphilum kamchatkense Kam1]|uniref:Large ribosomal subunit protein bL9 n=1 Tax=Methylacidiphilum kamchatkense Kam1 TaxID=1202785 RepID=A0A0C1RMK0_9BACT|nr:50S ribosomal protein L9 [Methylacidiphilum kamchatkense]KIE59267.1 50S ribosomal protein L9 [Methylacidiphilum kamchatkense Kam1]QDQ42773.1 large subunit ribosomal protein L9 [Methylacidiphilum kamchatkense Kam1]